MAEGRDTSLLDELVATAFADEELKRERRDRRRRGAIAASALRRGAGGWHFRFVAGKNERGAWRKPTVFLGTFDELPDRAAAEAAAKRFLERTRPARSAPGTSPLWSRFAESYLEEHVRSLRDGTRRTQRSIITRHLSRFDAMRLDEITPVKVQAFIWEMHGAGASLETIKQRIATLRAMLRDAKGRGFAVEVPSELIWPADDRAPRTHEEITFTREEATACLSIAESREKAAFALAMYVGLRVGEICGLEWRAVDLERAKLSVRQQVKRGRAVAPKTRGSVARLTLPAEVLEILTAWRAECPVGAHWLFPSPRRQGPICEDTLRRALVRTCEAAGVEYKHGMHAFRRRFSDALIESGATLPVISAALRHRHLATTLRYLSPAHRPDVEAAVAAAASLHALGPARR